MFNSREMIVNRRSPQKSFRSDLGTEPDNCARIAATQTKRSAIDDN
jgi:hypothetical protein